MREAEEERAPARPGRCAVHPGAVEVGRCEVCARALCLSCAIPVRGATVGLECLGQVVEDVPEPVRAPVRAAARGDILAMVGFGLVVALSVLPWSKYGDASQFFGAWTVHWALLSVTTASAGLIAAAAMWRRPGRPRREAALLSALALLVILGAGLHALHPPPLSKAALDAWLPAIFGAGIVLTAALLKLWALRERPARAARRRAGRRRARGRVRA